MKDFFESYATTDDVEVEDELNQLAAQIEEESLPSKPIYVPKEKEKEVEKAPAQPVNAKESQIKELENFLES
jgi:hypothetical protein